MSKRASHRALNSVLVSYPPSLDELSAAIDAELLALRNIDAFYQSKRQCLEVWSGSRADKDRLMARIDLCWKRDRERHTAVLTELRERLESFQMFYEDETVH
jgi:hypothetical protein